MPTNIIRLFQIVKAKILGRKLALCDEGDCDGIISATLFKMKYPKSEIVLAFPAEVKRSIILNFPEWYFVADLPCPKHAIIRADHHKTNPPKAKIEYYDPNAPCSAILALKALGLNGNSEAVKLVKIAVETDTGNFNTYEAKILTAAIKGSSYIGKLRIVNSLAKHGVKAIRSSIIQSPARKYLEVMRETEKLAKSLPLREILILVFKRRYKLSYRYLCILAERKGAKFTCCIVPKGLFSIRVYLGASRGSYDCSKIALKLGGGGHPYAAGAIVKSFRRHTAINKILETIVLNLGLKELEYYEISYSNGKFNLERRSLKLE